MSKKERHKIREGQLPKYEVFVQEVITNSGFVEIEADNEQAARELAEENDGIFNTDDLEPETTEITVLDIRVIEE